MCGIRRSDLRFSASADRRHLRPIFSVASPLHLADNHNTRHPSRPVRGSARAVLHSLPGAAPDPPSHDPGRGRVRSGAEPAEAAAGRRVAVGRRRGRRVHPRLPRRRAESPRHVGSEARRPGRGPRRVPADPDQRPRASTSASTCPSWPGGCTSRRSSGRPTTASTTRTRRPCTASSPATTAARPAAAVPGLTTTRPSARWSACCDRRRRRYRRTCCCRSSPGGGRPPAAAGFFGGFLGKPATRSSSSATRTPGTSRGPNSPSGRTSTPAGSTPASCCRPGSAPRPPTGRWPTWTPPGPGLRPAHLPGRPGRGADRPRVAADPRRLRPEHLRPIGALGPPAGGSGDAGRVRVVGTGRQRHWDTHGNNFTRLKSELLPQFDAAASSLLDDLHEPRPAGADAGVFMGEFGRTPKVNGNGGGRDHWNFCYSLVLAGGGREGRVRPRGERQASGRSRAATRRPRRTSSPRFMTASGCRRRPS